MRGCVSTSERPFRVGVRVMSIAISGVVLWSVALLAQAPEASSPVGPLETTAAPAHLIKDINATPDVHNRGSGILGLIRAGNLVYFTASTQTTGVEIWRTDGTPGGTFVPAELPGRYYNPGGAWEANGILYFFAQTRGGDYELWRSDGTKAGTWRFKQFFGEIPVSL